MNPNNQNTLKVFSGSSNMEFTSQICNHLNVKIGEIFRHTFPSGESYCQIKENVRGSDVFLVSCKGENVNDSLMELLVMSDAARRASAERITAVIPLFYYSRSDRKDKSRVPISAKLVLDLIQSAGINRILTMDLHSPQICGFTNLPFDHLTFEPVLSKYLSDLFPHRDNLIIMAPDVGAVKRAEKYAETLGCDFGFISKKRVGDETVQFQSLVGDVKDKSVVIIDDMTESAGTLIQAAQACKVNGAKEIFCSVSHGCFTSVGMERLCGAMPPIGDSLIDGFIHSDSANIWWNLKYKPLAIKTLSVSKLFSSAINSIHNNESVSELFV
jgi:ribose-phosphate pyrophosphokinase